MSGYLFSRVLCELACLQVTVPLDQMLLLLSKHLFHETLSLQVPETGASPVPLSHAGPRSLRYSADLHTVRNTPPLTPPVLPN